MTCMIPIVLCFYHHQQIEINHGHVSIVSIGLKKISVCVKLVIMHIQRTISILQVRKEKKLNIVFNNEDMELYNQIVEQAELHNISYQSVVKRMIEYYQYINGKPDK